MNVAAFLVKNTRPRQTAGAYGYTAAAGTGVSSVAASAGQIVPFLVEQFHPQSVLDVGCGTGDWLAEFQKLGVTDVMGYDGEWVPEKGRLLPPERFRAVDFNGAFPPPGNYELALCLEVGDFSRLPIS